MVIPGVLLQHGHLQGADLEAVYGPAAAHVDFLSRQQGSGCRCFATLLSFVVAVAYAASLSQLRVFDHCIVPCVHS